MEIRAARTFQLSINTSRKSTSQASLNRQETAFSKKRKTLWNYRNSTKIHQLEDCIGEVKATEANEWQSHRDGWFDGFIRQTTRR